MIRRFVAGTAPALMTFTATGFGLPTTAATASADMVVANDVDIDVVIPGVEGIDVSNAQLRWGLNMESGSGAFYGGCNFLSAGVVGDTRGGKVWTADHGFYSSSDGHTTIEKPYLRADDTYDYRAMPFSDRCMTPDGSRQVRSSVMETTGVQAVIDGGTGTIDPESGDAEIEWEGSFTVVFYGGLTYWWVIDPWPHYPRSA